MTPYADTNFFPRIYLRLPESEQAARLLDDANAQGSPPFPVTWLHRLEIINAFQLHVFTGNDRGQVRVTVEQAATAHATFRSDLAQPGFIRPARIELTDLEGRFEDLALRHTGKYGFRTYELIHVASALLLECDTFWSFDPKASKLASLEGLRVR